MILLIAFNVMSGSLQCALQWLSNHFLCLICLINLLNVSIIIDNVVDKLIFIVIEYFKSFFFIRNLTKQVKNIKCIYSAFSFLGCKNVGLRDLRFTKPAYTKRNQRFDAKSAQNVHILKNIKSFDREKPPNLYILKTINKNQKSQTLCGVD